MRVKVHPFIETKGKTDADRKEIKEQTRNVILHQLSQFAKSNN
jgi:1-acyl-sn-glycerol-3-phosphate acyltransferase